MPKVEVKDDGTESVEKKTGIEDVLKIIGEILLSPIFFFMQWLAEENILWTTCKEGTAKIVLRGDSFDHIIMSFKSYHINDPRKKGGKKGLYKEDYEQENEQKNKTRKKIPDWEVVYHGRDNTRGFTNENDDYYDDRSWLLKRLGLYWVGFPWSNSIYVYSFEWNEVTTEKLTGKAKILPRGAATDFTYTADFMYVIVTPNAETRELIPIDVVTVVVVATRNPVRALLYTEDWMQIISSAINAYVKNFVGSRLITELITPAKDIEDEITIKKGWEKFSHPIIKLNDELPDDDENDKRSLKGTEGRYGITIRKAFMISAELSTTEGKEQLRAATTKKYVAEREADATRIEGRAKSDVIEMVGTSEALSIKVRLETLKEYGELGEAFANFEAMRKIGEGPNNTFVIGDIVKSLSSESRKLFVKGDEKE